jgi:hypothetical protein
MRKILSVLALVCTAALAQTPQYVPLGANAYYPTTFSDLQAAVTACGSSACSIYVDGTIAVTSNTSIPTTATVVLMNGGQLQPSAAVTLTLNGLVVAPPVKIFGGSGAVVLGAINNFPAFEWFGAVGDWNGSTGTDNATALNACTTAITNGQCVLQAKQYKTSVTVNIVKSHVGIKGFSTGYTAGSLYPTPSPSGIVYTQPTGSVVKALGTDISHTIAFGRFEDFSIIRSVAPTVGAAAAGLELNYYYGAFVNRVTAQDHLAGFYFHGQGSQGMGYIENCTSINGYNGVTLTTGSSAAGFEIDSQDGVPSNSIRIRNSFAVSNPGMTGVTSFGLYIVGNQTHDVMATHVETATVNFGAYIQSGAFGFTDSSDIHLNDMVHDGCITSCTYITGVGGSVTINGGWYYKQSSSNPNIQIESSSHVQISNIMMYSPTGSGVGILAHNSGSIKISGNDFGSVAGSAVKFDNTSASKISDNIMNGVTATSVIALVTNSVSNVISGNTINGTATNGISIDNTSTGTVGLETNQIGLAGLGTITTKISDAANSQNPRLPQVYSAAGTLLATPHVVVSNGSLSAGSATVTLTGAAAFTANMSCVASDVTSTNPIKVVNSSFSSVTLTGTGTDQYQLFCGGN